MTFTILGRCDSTGQLGGAVTSSDIAVGARVLFARAGIGVVATQHRTDPRLGPLILARLARGDPPADAVRRVAGATPARAWRQLGALDAGGGVGTWSGERLWPIGAELPGPGCLVLGNMLDNRRVAPAMADAFAQTAELPLAQRLLSALAAGEAAGGERDGRLRSAALLVVERESFPFVDLRIDDDRDPLGRLQALWDAYRPLASQFVARALSPDDVQPSSSTTT